VCTHSCKFSILNLVLLNIEYPGVLDITAVLLNLVSPGLLGYSVIREYWSTDGIRMVSGWYPDGIRILGILNLVLLRGRAVCMPYGIIHLAVCTHCSTPSVHSVYMYTMVLLYTAAAYIYCSRSM
jgi:hypothetical protein